MSTKVKDIPNSLASEDLQANKYYMYATSLDGATDYKVKTNILSPILTKKISFTSAQIKTLNSIPIDTGISISSGQAIEVISAVLNWNAGTTPFFSFGYLSLIIDTATNGWYPAIVDYSINKFVQFVYDQSVGYDLIENKSLMITADANSSNGSGSCDIYINYKIITL